VPPNVDSNSILELLAKVQGCLHEVEQVAGKRLSNGHWFYLIIWKGYSIEEYTWEPE
jgi:hypothetical protein